MKRMLLTFSLGCVILVSAGCVTQPAWHRYELCFGLSRDSGTSLISEQEWQTFEEREIAPRFPDGFTVTQGSGHWSSNGKTYSEPSEILMVVATDPIETQKKLDAITQAYAREFKQESVLQITVPAEVEFHSVREE
jgi:hypothetical protein